MFDTIQFSKFRSMAALMTVTLAISGLPLSLSSNAYIRANAGSRMSAAIPAFAPPVVQSPPPTYNLLLQDDSTHDMLRWNSTTGAYQYSRCGDGFILTGTGSVTSRGNTFTLTQYGSDRRVTATLDVGMQSGSASVQYPLGTTYTITDRSWTPDPGLSDQTPPQVGVTAPNGGEIVDVGSIFTIMWDASDNVGVASQDILLSTDGGGTFTTITTGLAGSVSQYAWSVPAMVNNQTGRVRVVARDAACNVSHDDSNSNFTIWNPPASFSHVAEAPLFFTGQGFTSTIFMTNTSGNAVVVELDPHNPDGNASQNYPMQVLLNAGASATVDAASLYAIGPSAQDPDVADMIDGGIRLRHNGSQDSDVRAIVAAERSCSEKFTTPFTYAASSLSASGTMLCGPMYYVDNNTDAFVSIQNTTNAPQTVELTCNYGTGASGTPNGQIKNQPITLGPQQTSVVNLNSIWSQFGGAEWGSMAVFTTNPQSVVCHSVMMSAHDGIAWDCPFVDPAMSANTTKVTESVMLDYNANENAYIMVCNTSATNSRTVTASFKTGNGVTIPPVQLTVAPDAQQLITLNAQQLLSPGASTVADARLTYTGNASDIVAAGCSTSSSAGRAVPVKFKEATVNDGRRLTSPYFRFDQNVSGKLEISNLGSSSVKVGARMVFANSTAKPLKTSLLTIPAGGVGAIDLSSANDGVPDGVDSIGRVDLIHSGPAGTVTAAVTELGCGNSGQVIPLDGGPPIDPLTLFPIGVVIIPGACTVVDAITDGTVTNPSVTSTNQCFGGAIQMFGTGTNTWEANICVPVACSSDVPINWPPSGGTGTPDESDLVVEQSNFAGFSTSLGTRLNPNGTTSFTLNAQNAFPNSLLEVDFVGKGGTVFIQAQGNGTSTSITGIGPMNHTFLGNVKKIQVIQLNPDGTQNISVPPILKAKNSGAYYALDKPTSITSITPNAVPVTGGTVTIKGTGFQTWPLIIGGNTVTVNPTVLVGVGNPNKHDQIPFTVISTPDLNTIMGNVGPTPDTVFTCAVEGQTPCKTITVINPGGSDGIDDLTSAPLLTINPPPAPVITGTAALTASGGSGPATSNSVGMQNIRVRGGLTAALPVTAQILGRNLSRVRSVTFGSQRVPVGPSDIKGGTEIDVGVPAFCLTAASASVSVIADDQINTPVSFANGWIFTATGPIQVFVPNVPLGGVAFLVGPCENVVINIPSGSTSFVDCTFQGVGCVQILSPLLAQHGVVSTLFPNANIAVLTWNPDCSACSPKGSTFNGFFLATATNDKSGSQVSLCLATSCTAH